MKMNIVNILEAAVDSQASDIHITVGSPIIYRVHGRLEKIGRKPLTAEDTKLLVEQTLNERQKQELDKKGEVDLSFSGQGLGRFRVNAYMQRGTYSMAFRLINLEIPSMEKLGLPRVIKELCTRKRGLILVTGPTGSGKSTTLASMIDYMNHTRNDHIITIEDPIEYLHTHNTSIVNQREIGYDSESFGNALRASLRQDPDIILLGEMRDLETIATAITSAETGHLVLSTLHTNGSAKTIDRIIDVFMPHQQPQVRSQLAGVIEAVISQQIIPKIDGRGRVVAFEVMIATPAVRNLIREGKTHQMQTIIETGSRYGMQTMDKSLMDLYKRSLISLEDAKRYSYDQKLFSENELEIGGMF